MDDLKFPPRFFIDTPNFLELDGSGKFSFFGWCLLGRGIQPKKAHIRINNIEAAVLDFNQRRPDVLTFYPGYDVEDLVGFHTLIDVLQDVSCMIEVTVEGDGGSSFSFSKDITFLEKDFAKSNRLLSKEFEDKGYLHKYPEGAYVEITTACNLNCITCCGRDKKRIQHMDKDTFTGLLDFLSKVNVIRLFGNGEPTVHPDFLGMFKRVRSVNPTAMISFCTNFNDIDGALMTTLVGDVYSEISISLDAATKQTYEKIRRNGSWDKVIRNIKRLHELKSAANSKFPPITVSFVVQKYNIDEIADFVRLVNELTKPDLIVFNHIEHYPEWEVNYGEYLGKIREAFDELKKHNNAIGGSGYLMMCNALGIKDEQTNVLGSSNGKPYCYEPFQTIIIEANGNVRTCCYNQTIFGNVLEEGVEDVWNGYKYNLFRQMMTEKPSDPECIECIKICRNQPKLKT